MPAAGYHFWYHVPGSPLVRSTALFVRLTRSHDLPRLAGAFTNHGLARVSGKGRDLIHFNGNYHSDVTVLNNVAPTGPVTFASTVTTATKGEFSTPGGVVSTGATPEPVGWEDLVKTNSALTSSAFKSNHAAPSGNVGRYGVGWDS